MDIRITAAYPATDGSMPETVEVAMEGVAPVDANGLIGPALGMLLTAPSSRISVQKPWTVTAAEMGTPSTVARDATDLAEQMREEERSELQPVRADRICLRVGCGHVQEGHGPSVCTLCPPDRPCAGFFGMVPARLVAGKPAHRGELLAADVNGIVRPAVDCRAAVLLGSATSEFKEGDHLDFARPAGPGLYGAWTRKGER